MPDIAEVTSATASARPFFNEEWPFISAQSDVLLEPGMVIAFETPYYIRGLGGFIIEELSRAPGGVGALSREGRMFGGHYCWRRAKWICNSAR